MSPDLVFSLANLSSAPATSTACQFRLPDPCHGCVAGLQLWTCKVCAGRPRYASTLSLLLPAERQFLKQWLTSTADNLKPRLASIVTAKALWAQSVVSVPTPANLPWRSSPRQRGPTSRRNARRRRLQRTRNHSLSIRLLRLVHLLLHRRRPNERHSKEGDINERKELKCNFAKREKC